MIAPDDCKRRVEELAAMERVAIDALRSTLWALEDAHKRDLAAAIAAEREACRSHTEAMVREAVVLSQGCLDDEGRAIIARVMANNGGA